LIINHQKNQKIKELKRIEKIDYIIGFLFFLLTYKRLTKIAVQITVFSKAIPSGIAMR